jgi:hypothetical protein
VERLWNVCSFTVLTLLNPKQKNNKRQADLQKTEVNEINLADLEQADDGPGVPVPEDE